MFMFSSEPELLHDLQAPVLGAMKAPLIAGTPLGGREGLMAHLSDIVIYQGAPRLPVACKLPPSWWYPVRVIVMLTARCPSFPKKKKSKNA